MNTARIKVDIEITTRDKFAGWSKQSENFIFLLLIQGYFIRVSRTLAYLIHLC